MTFTGTPPPRWTVLAAWAVPLCVLPSAVWRAVVVARGEVAWADGGWYLVLLSVLSMAFASLTPVLVRPWGERRPPRLVAGAATLGAALVIALCCYALVNQAFGVVDRGPVLVGRDDPEHPPPGADVGLAYLPLLLWGPLVLAVTRDYRGRSRPATASKRSTRCPAGPR